MPAYKQTKTVSSVATPMFKLAADTLARTFAIGSDWSTLRFGFRAQLDAPPAAGIASAVRFDFGLDSLSGPLYPSVFDAPNSGAHYIVQRNAFQLQNRVAGPPVVFYASAGANEDAVVDGHDLINDFTSATGQSRISGDPNIMGCYIIEISKGADYSYSYLFPGVDAMVNRTAAELATAMGVADMATALLTLGGTYSLATRTITGAAARAALYGQLNRVFVSWAGDATNPVNLTDFTLRRMA